ncbi:serine/threonine-protein kinase [Oxynema aestuarii]|uniref:Protein kinase n=1 Tax=Oxynema aestuarii AP17 TaxID=2064643 RepID=A0A6H1TX67_9CYAN|nr:serine/threonine-protein kinase [Oxynema aestuarii]QIZ71161.1 protein kinase [Oxynema aestuarii AP17]
MSFCFNPRCAKPKNPDSNNFCQNCGSKLLLRERYRAVKFIGKGTYSRTFLAIDEDLPSKPACAIKQLLLTSQGNDKQASRQFKREAMQLDLLGKHPQIPQLLAYFTQDNARYLVQEWIEGKTLAAELAETGGFSESKIIELLEDILTVLKFVHGQSAIHRDIKPANIIRRKTKSFLNEFEEKDLAKRRDRLVLVGFGSSKLLPRTSPGGSSTIIGSAEYAAPEQLSGQAVFASDLYSLGMTCIQLITEMDLFSLAQGEEGLWKSRMVRPISVRLVEIIEKMVQPLTGRYTSATAILEDLASLQPIAWDCVEILTGVERVRCVAVSPDARVVVGGGEDSQVKLWDLGGQGGGDSLGNWMSGHSGGIQAVAFAPDGQQILTGSSDRSIKVWDRGTRKCVRSLGDWFAKHSGPVNALAISANGQFVVSGSQDATVRVWNLAKGKSLATLSGHLAWVECVAIASNYRYIASGGGDREVKLWDAESGKLTATLTGHEDTVQALAFGPDGEVLASASRDRTVVLWQVSTTERLATLTHRESIEAIAFHPRSPLLVAGDRAGCAVLWNPYTFAKLGEFSAHQAAVTALAFAPDGTILVSGSSDSSVKVWKLAR